MAVECKWSSRGFDPGNIQAFRHLYPKGDNIVVAHDVKKTFTRKYDDIAIQFESLPSLIQKVVE
jgi:hypothetical protein